MLKENANINKSPNDVDSIRKILFGDQATQIEDRFNSIETSINQIRSEIRNLRQALEAESTMRQQALEAESTMREQALEAESTMREQALEAESTMRQQANGDLNNLIQALEEKLKARDTTQTSLVSALQQVLDQHRKKVESLNKSEK
jgi:septation ring formation regulator EzrA